MPCRGVPQTAHASAFNVISAPQHAQKAAISVISPTTLALWMNQATAKIQPGYFRSALQVDRKVNSNDSRGIFSIKG